MVFCTDIVVTTIIFFIFFCFYYIGDCGSAHGSRAS